MLKTSGDTDTICCSEKSEVQKEFNFQMHFSTYFLVEDWNSLTFKAENFLGCQRFSRIFHIRKKFCLQKSKTIRLRIEINAE